MSYSKALLDAIPSLQNQLPELLDEKSAKLLGDRLARLLQNLPTEPQASDLQTIIEIAEEVEEALGGFPATHQWLESFKSQDSEGDRKSYEPLPGPTTPVLINEYHCPEPNCDHVWPRRSVGQTIPLCPTHQIPLIPSQQSRASQ